MAKDVDAEKLDRVKEILVEQAPSHGIGASIGDRGPHVDTIQEILSTIGYTTIKEDGYGVATKAAVSELQKALGVKPTGDWNKAYDEAVKLWNGKSKDPVASAFSIADAYIDKSSKAGKILDTAQKIYSVSKLFTGSGTNNKDADAVTSILGGQSKESNHEVGSGPEGTAVFTYDYIPCYVYNMNTGTTIHFGVCTPEEISDSYSANFEDQAVKGRSSPFKAFDNSGPRSLSFTVEMIADYCAEGLVQTINRLRALCYPFKNTVIMEPRCQFVVGSFLKVTCVPQSVDVTWKKPYKDGIYTIADVSFSLSEVEDVGIFATEVEG